MQCTTKRRLVQLVLVRWHILVMLGLLVLVLGGQMPDSVAGWLTYAPRVVSGVPVSRRRGRAAAAGRCPASPWRHLRHTIHLPLLRSGLLGGLWFCSGAVGPLWVCLVPWGLWGWQSAGVLWPRLRRQPEWRGIHWLWGQGQRWLLVGYLGLALRAWWQGQTPSLALPELEPAELGAGSWALGLGCVVPSTALRTGGQREEPWVEVIQEADGSYTATLCGHFTWHVAGDHPFRVRVLMHGLRALEVPGPQRSGRRTRDGRTPFVAQEQLAAWFQLPQPDISRLEHYWLAGEWANLLSLQTAEPLTHELRARVVTVSLFEKIIDNRKELGITMNDLSKAFENKQGNDKMDIFKNKMQSMTTFVTREFLDKLKEQISGEDAIKEYFNKNADKINNRLFFPKVRKSRTLFNQLEQILHFQLKQLFIKDKDSQAKYIYGGKNIFEEARENYKDITQITGMSEKMKDLVDKIENEFRTHVIFELLTYFYLEEQEGNVFMESKSKT